jgi:Flp pilus assembly protein TadD
MMTSEKPMKSLIVLSGVLIAILAWQPASLASGQQKQETEICDAAADFYLGIEDYPRAIRLHRAVLKRAPQDALAHYHLGFAYGMVGRSDDEIREYQRAAALGLRLFDLYLNLGTARFERGDLAGATEAFQTASRLSDGPEPRFDLAMTYERRGNLPEAESEIRAALVKEPNQPDYLNTLAIIVAERGDPARAHEIWTGILSRNPGYHPAAANLAVLKAVDSSGSVGESVGAGAKLRLISTGIR